MLTNGLEACRSDGRRCTGACPLNGMEVCETCAGLRASYPDHPQLIHNSSTTHPQLIHNSSTTC
eukprot:7859968-Pyramimonas_sp.AAC.3